MVCIYCGRFVKFENRVKFSALRVLRESRVAGPAVCWVIRITSSSDRKVAISASAVAADPLGWNVHALPVTVKLLSEKISKSATNRNNSGRSGIPRKIRASGRPTSHESQPYEGRCFRSITCLATSTPKHSPKNSSSCISKNTCRATGPGG